MKVINCLFILLSYGNFLETKAQDSPATVIISAGQSNMDGRVSNDDLPDYIKKNGYHHCYWSYGSDTISGNGRFELFWPRVAKPDNHKRWGFDAVVYYLMEQQLCHDFFVIKESLGGSAIDTACVSTNGMYWSASPAFLSSTKAADKGGKSLLKAFTENIGACIDNKLSKLENGYKITAFLWHQGESDKNSSAHYYENIKNLVKYIRDYLVIKTGDDSYFTLPVICGTYSQKSHGRDERIVDSLYRLAEEDSHFYVVDMSDGTIQPDNLHFDAKGAELFGKRVYGILKNCTKTR